MNYIKYQHHLRLNIIEKTNKYFGKVKKIYFNKSVQKKNI